MTTKNKNKNKTQKCKCKRLNFSTSEFRDSKHLTFRFLYIIYVNQFLVAQIHCFRQNESVLLGVIDLNISVSFHKSFKENTLHTAC